MQPSNFAFPRLEPALVAAVAFATAGLVLAFDPVVWLVRIWRDPANDQHGFVVAALTAGLAARSVVSPYADPASRHWMSAVGLLLTSAMVRLCGQVLAINVLGALTLVLDVYAMGLLLGLDRRAFAISPGWLAIVFAFALPLERIVQRSIGYLLQQLSADGACGVLQLWFGSVTCEGVRIVLDGKDVLVDLPCSGARTALLSLLAFAVIACLTRPRLLYVLAGLAIAMVAAYAANVLRITVLAIGIAHPESLGGVDVMAAPWHDAIGLAALSLVLLALLAWGRRVTRRAAAVNSILSSPRATNSQIRWVTPNAAITPHGRTVLGCAALAVSLFIVSQPRRPIDVADRNIALEAPAWISGEPAEPIALDPREAAYFTQHGGAAAKARYGAHNLLLVRTSSPLRHLHEPEECLRGLGFAVRYAGMIFEPLPTAVYAATSPDGARFRIDVSFVSNRGHVTTNVATAVWHWMRGEAAVWTAIQRITPATIPIARHDQWSAAALTALGVGAPLSPRINHAATGVNQ